MNNSNPIENSLLDLMQQAITEPDQEYEEVNLEKVAVIASGKINQLSEEEREQTLNLIATNPEAAELYKDLCNIESQEAATDTRSPSFWQSNKTFKALKVSWLAAACLMVGFFVWNMQPSSQPTSSAPAGNGIKALNNQENNPDYWQQLNNKRIYENQDTSFQEKCLPYAMAVSTTTCLTLSIALIICMTKRKD